MLTRDDVTDTLAAYINGNQVWTFIDTAGDAAFDGTNHIIRFFQDDTASGSNSKLKVASLIDIRMLDEALNAAQVLDVNRWH